MFTFVYISSQAYEKRQRGEQEEEEAEDEIFSHKAVVTKFLNKVKVLLFERKIMSSRSDLNFLFSAILSVRVANCIWQVLFSSALC